MLLYSVITDLRYLEEYLALDWTGYDEYRRMLYLPRRLKPHVQSANLELYFFEESDLLNSRRQSRVFKFCPSHFENDFAVYHDSNLRPSRDILDFVRNTLDGSTGIFFKHYRRDFVWQEITYMFLVGKVNFTQFLGLLYDYRNTLKYNLIMGGFFCLSKNHSAIGEVILDRYLGGRIDRDQLAMSSSVPKENVHKFPVIDGRTAYSPHITLKQNRLRYFIYKLLKKTK